VLKNKNYVAPHGVVFHDPVITSVTGSIVIIMTLFSYTYLHSVFSQQNTGNILLNLTVRENEFYFTGIGTILNKEFDKE
jgi:hypothetical protein